MPDHFYTTNLMGELAMQNGYWLEQRECMVLPSQPGPEIGFYHWIHPASHLHFYCTAPAGERAPEAGYHFQQRSCTVFSTQQPGTVPLFRWHHPANGDHFYCLDPSGELAPSVGYNSEGIACYVYATQQNGTVPLHRYYNNTTASHLYTTDPSKENLTNFVAEGIACYVKPNSRNNITEFYRWYNPVTGFHFYTKDANRLMELQGYHCEGIACFVYASAQTGTVPLYMWFDPVTQNNFWSVNPADPRAVNDGYQQMGIACHVHPLRMVAPPEAIPFERWIGPSRHVAKIVIHFVSVIEVTDVRAEFFKFQFSKMAEVYLKGLISPRLGTILDLSAEPNIALVRNVQVGNCERNRPLVGAHESLFLLRPPNAAPTDIVVYLVANILNTLQIPMGVDGCASHPPNVPGCLVEPALRQSSFWLTAHEVAHVLGLPHICDEFVSATRLCRPGDNRNLMFGGSGPFSIAPPELNDDQFNTMLNSPWIINV